MSNFLGSVHGAGLFVRNSRKPAAEALTVTGVMV
ncbi:UNVERIFIED_ORG: hypothetical protein M2435_004997 [Rhizobium sophorae]|nr:hypothetical protein [Rhizobium leguminosarum]MDH6662074.1 hypothetical protein [Rhizobium sophorae]